MNENNMSNMPAALNPCSCGSADCEEIEEVLPLPDIVAIDWVDIATSHPTWTPHEEIMEIRPVLCHIVGFVVEETEEYVIIVQNISDMGLDFNSAVFPRGCIVNMRRLR